MNDLFSLNRLIEARTNAKAALVRGLPGLLSRTGDAARLGRIAALVPEYAGREREDIKRALLVQQRDDGGWANVEETIWSVGALFDEPAALDRGCAWMATQRSESGGWGRAARESPNFMITGLALTMLPSVRTGPDYGWLEDSWRRHLGEETRLAYKGALFLRAHRQKGESSRDLVEATIKYVSLEQNVDGGFAPWRGHPIGSDPWSTGLCLVGLSAFPELVELPVLERAVQWLVDTQLPTGHWAYHFIDEGTAYAYWGLSEAARLLGGS